MTHPSPWTVGWHAFSEEGEDRNGNPIPVHIPPLDAEGVGVAVMGWAPTQTSEPEQNHSLDLLDLFVPPGTQSHPRDVVDLPEGQFEVVGMLQDFTKGPFGFAPGGVVKLRRFQ